MKKPLRFPARAAVLLLGLCGISLAGAADQAPFPLPSLAKELPGECRQTVLTLAKGVNDLHAQVWLLERGAADAPWKAVAGPLEANIGRNGVGFGKGEHRPAEPPPGMPVKKEGDGRSPAGIFRIPYAFGTAPAAEPGMRLPWKQCVPTLRGVDDSASRYYNQVVDEALIKDKDWNSAEVMLQPEGLYQWGASIAHNPDNIPAGGSCIFLHLRRGPDQGTAGCTALDRPDLLRILTWLDPGKQPRFLLSVEARP